MLAAHRVLHAPHTSASYDSVILADSPSYFWELAESSGTTATDSADSNAGTYQGTVTLGQTGIGDGQTAVLLDGSTGYISTTTNIASPGPQPPFSLEIWFKVTNGYSSGGGLFAFNANQTGTNAASQDRQVWLRNDGTLTFGVYPGSVVQVSSTSSYNDGNWHYVVARMNASNNMALYVDGASVASNSNTGAPVGYSGWWRIGELPNNSGWGGNPSSAFLAGTIAKAAIYPAALTSTQISNHYAAA